MPTERAEEGLLLNYLLGNLSEEEQTRVEDRAFADAEYRGVLEGVEADLIDSYVRGELPVADRLKFERRFLMSPQRRSKVEFARALARASAEFQPSRLAGRERPSFWQGLLSLMRGLHPAVPFAAVTAALAVVAAATWFGVQNSAMRSRIAALEAQRTVLEKQEQTRAQQLSHQEPVATTAQNRPATEPPALLASLVFLPGLPRAESRVRELSLKPGTQLVRVEIQLEARDEFPRFRAELRTRGGDEVLARSGLTGRRRNGVYAVSFEIPGSTLAAGEYEFALKGLSENQATDIGYYYFRVEKP